MPISESQGCLKMLTKGPADPSNCLCVPNTVKDEDEDVSNDSGFCISTFPAPGGDTLMATVLIAPANSKDDNVHPARKSSRFNRLRKESESKNTSGGKGRSAQRRRLDRADGFAEEKLQLFQQRMRGDQPEFLYAGG
jgi:hypothetical protein